MTGVRVELANPNAYASPREYIEQHLAPAVAELHRITNELLVPGSCSSEEWAVDMVPSVRGAFSPLDRRVAESPKHVVFDGSEYQSLPKELLRTKRLMVQFAAVVYVINGVADFRLVRDDGAIVSGSQFRTPASSPTTITCQLPFGNAPGCVAPNRHSYIIQGKGLDADATPVCRRFSMSFIYL